MQEVIKSSRYKRRYDRFIDKYFFCSETGSPIHSSNLRHRVWIPVLEKACIEFREMKQARHTFATIALSCGENPLWIDKVMGHRDTTMIIKVYGKYVENVSGSEDGLNLDAMYQRIKISKKEE